jgi:hypothetical protein
MCFQEFQKLMEILQHLLDYGKKIQQIKLDVVPHTGYKAASE